MCAATSKTLREVLVAEDNPDDRALLEEAWSALRSARTLRQFEDGQAFLAHLDRVEQGEEPLPGLLVVDMKMPGLNGEQVLRDLRGRRSLASVPVVALSASPSHAAQAYAAGSMAFILKPRTFEAMLGICRILDEMGGDGERDDRPSEPARRPRKALELLGPCRSPAMREFALRLERVVLTQLPVLLQGESGTGKERVARIVHESGPRAHGPWVTENCGAISPELVESEMFGHCRGAFTGATAHKIGLFELAHGGTLFLDEIADLPHRLQSKLLRVLEEREVRPVGATESRPVDVRVISATNRDLVELVRQEHFREDLYFRLAVVRLELPALRDRPEDLEPLVHALLAEVTGRPGMLEVAPGAWDALASHRWPGNIRELRNLLQRVVLFSGQGPIQADHVRAELGRPAGEEPEGGGAYHFTQAQGQFEAAYLERLLRSCHGDIPLAVQRSGLPRATLYRLIKRAGLKPADFRQTE